MLTDQSALTAHAKRETGARNVAKNAVKTGSAGAAVGGLTGILATPAAITIPGLRPALAAGMVASHLIGDAGGADIAHNLRKADKYAECIRNGGVLVTVLAEGSLADQARALMERAGAIV